MLPRDEDSSTVSIRDGFCVTDKADGDLKLLYIDTNNKLFFIDTNLNVQYTGCDLDKALNMRHTIIDGEHLTSDKYGNRINTFAAFDIYCHNKYFPNIGTRQMLLSKRIPFFRFLRGLRDIFQIMYLSMIRWITSMERSVFSYCWRVDYQK